jgi:hypothetical protein
MKAPALSEPVLRASLKGLRNMQILKTEVPRAVMRKAKEKR